MNLNNMKVRVENGPVAAGESRTIVERQSSDGKSFVYFDRLTERLIRHIQSADWVFGCVAWLTSSPILDALAKKKGQVSIVVQKEDFLRPDLGSQSEFHQRLRQKYETLGKIEGRYRFPNIIHEYCCHDHSPFDAIRCVGNHNKSRFPAFPRSHHKFVVFCKDNEEFWPERDLFVPYAVWTGSFNFTHNSANSLENALYLTDQEIVRAYFAEYAHVLGLSEPLDWKSDWCEPEWRIGT